MAQARADIMSGALSTPGMEDSVRITSGARLPEPHRMSLRSLVASSPAIRRLVSSEPSLGIVEALAGALCLTVLGVVMRDHWGLLDVQPHPFWILVVAIALRYGPAPGYVAAVVASTCYAFFIWVGPGLHPQSPSLRELGQPFLLLAGGIVVSEIMRSQHRYLTALRQHSDHTSAMIRDLTQRQQALGEVNAELEKRLVTQSSSLIALHRVAKQLSVLDVEGVYAAIPAIVAEVFEAEACAIYEWRDGRLELRVGRPSHLPGRSDAWDLETGLIGRAFRDARVISIRERLIREGAHAIEEEPAMLAGPLLDREGQPLGVVVVERLPFLKLNAASVRLFETCLEWFSASLANAEAYQAAQLRAPLSGLDGHEGTGDAAEAGYAAAAEAGDAAEAGYAADIGTHPVDRAVSRLGEARARRAQPAVSALVIEMSGRALALPGLEVELRRMLGAAFGRRLRREEVGESAPHGRFLLILPEMREDGARALAGRIAAALRTHGLERMFAVTVTIVTLPEHEVSPERLPEAAAVGASPAGRHGGRQGGGVRRGADLGRKPHGRRRRGESWAHSLSATSR
jgi:hypothetical protein